MRRYERQDEPQQPTQQPDRLQWHPIFPEDANQPTPVPSEPGAQSQGSRIAGLVVLAMAAIAALLAIGYAREIGEFLGSIKDINRGSRDDQFIGFVAAGFIGVLIVAIVRILASNK